MKMKAPNNERIKRSRHGSHNSETDGCCHSLERLEDQSNAYWCSDHIKHGLFTDHWFRHPKGCVRCEKMYVLSNKTIDKKRPVISAEISRTWDRLDDGTLYQLIRGGMGKMS